MKRSLGPIVALLLFSVPVFAQKNKKKMLTAAATPHSVTLGWTQAVVPTGTTCPAGNSTAGAVTGNNVYRGTTSGGEGSTPYASLTAPATTYTDTAVTAGASYVYEVTAVNCNGESGKSSEVSVTIPNPLPPNAPTGLTVTASQ